MKLARAPIIAVSDVDKIMHDMDGKKVVLTNGVFDVFHRGHSDFLSACAEKGDYLIVGVNQDHSVRKLKGADRPLHSFSARASVVASIRWVDAVVGYHQDTADELLQRIRPNIYIKGSEYSPRTLGKVLPEWETANRLGISVHFVDLTPGYSSTAIINSRVPRDID